MSKLVDNTCQSNSNEKIQSEWSVNLGEMAVDITVVDSEWVLVLGERNVHCFNTKGKVKFMKHLSYTPICFHVYIKGEYTILTCYICNQFVFILDEDIFSLVVSENSTLLIYQNTTLKWSAKLQLVPVCLKRVFLQNIQGAIASLSEEGNIQCSYLGTEPSLFIAPPLALKALDLAKVEEEIASLNRSLRSFSGNEC